MSVELIGAKNATSIMKKARGQGVKFQKKKPIVFYGQSPAKGGKKKKKNNY